MANVLIVDDDDTIRFTLAASVRKFCDRVFEASDGDHALLVLNEYPIDLVITDIIMPNREGLGTIREIRMNWPDVKIIAMSSGGAIKSPDFLAVAEKFGASCILKKPFAMTEFTAQVRTILGLSAPQAT